LELDSRALLPFRLDYMALNCYRIPDIYLLSET